MTIITSIRYYSCPYQCKLNMRFFDQWWVWLFTWATQERGNFFMPTGRQLLMAASSSRMQTENMYLSETSWGLLCRSRAKVDIKTGCSWTTSSRAVLQLVAADGFNFFLFLARNFSTAAIVCSSKTDTCDSSSSEAALSLWRFELDTGSSCKDTSIMYNTNF